MLLAGYLWDDLDSLRVYYLGDRYKNKVEHIGANLGFDMTDTLRGDLDSYPVFLWKWGEKNVGIDYIWREYGNFSRKKTVTASG